MRVLILCAMLVLGSVSIAAEPRKLPPPPRFPLSGGTCEGSDDEACRKCAAVEKLVRKHSSVNFGITRTPMVRQYTPEKEYLYCVNMGIGDVGGGNPDAVFLQYGTHADGIIWLEIIPQHPNSQPDMETSRFGKTARASMSRGSII